ncbi:MAG: carboxypeptidase-like regulatory domain-containing protein, partial [Bryobacteraceae bacterium]
MRWLCYGLFPALVWAQSYTASVRGVVTDSSHAAVPSAKVTFVEVQRSLEHPTTTDSGGRYVLTALPPGEYVLTAEAPGFRKFSQPAFRLEVQQQATINVELSVGDLATSVDVQGAAPLLNTTIATLGQVVENRLIVSTPILNRNPLSLVMLAPGITPSNNAAGGVSNTNFVANGTRNSSAEVTLDGMNISGIEQNGGVTDVKYTPSVDVIQEFKVQTNFFNAEFGNTGGAIINMVSKSGTNELHGVIYEFHRNSALNANSWFSNRAGLTLPDSKRNVFGGTAGGPVFLPKLYNGKSRTFFFFDYEGNRDENATTTTGTVPTAQQLAGDFSDTRLGNGNLVPIYNPFDTYTAANGQTLRRVFGGNAVPASLHSRVARNVIPYYPKPTSEGNRFTRVNNFFAQGVNAGTGNKLDAKVDHNLSDKQRFTTRYSVSWGENNPANLTGNISDNSNPGSNRAQDFVFDYTRTHSPTTVFTARMGILRVRSARDPRSMGFDPTTLGLSPVFLTTGILAFPNFEASGYRGIGSAGYAIIHRYEDLGMF